jgi:peroxiredoxin
MSRSRIHVVLALLAGLAAGSASHAQSKDAQIRLEGSGSHRALNTAIQLKPFPTALWKELTNWSGTPVTAESLKDKPVLLVTWTSYAKSTNNPAVLLAQRLHTKHAEKGLVVVGVHNPKGFDTAKPMAEQLKLTFPFAADEKGAFRNGLLVDSDPDFYVIDRAGNLRFADVESSSVEQAVELVLAETPEQAATAPAEHEKTLAAAEREKHRIRSVKGLPQPGSPLTVPFNPPAEEVFERANWPLVITKTGASQFDTMAEKIRKDRPPLPLSDEGWASPKPVATGRVMLVYLFDPLDTQIAGVASKMARLQDAHIRDLVVVANVMKSRDDASATEEEKQRNSERRLNSARDYVRQNSLNHAMNVVPIQVEGINDGTYVVPTNSRQQVTLAFLVSTDGRCRWVGNQYWDGFETVVSSFIEADPGVKARRHAEATAAKLSGN